MRIALVAAVVCVVSTTPAAIADGLRDPMRPPIPESHAAAVREALPVLSAIMSSSDGRTAIVNGLLVRSGTAVGGYVIEAVLTDGVRMRRGTETRELHLVPPTSTFKKPAADAAAPSGAH